MYPQGDSHQHDLLTCDAPRGQALLPGSYSLSLCTLRERANRWQLYYDAKRPEQPVNFCWAPQIKLFQVFREHLDTMKQRHRSRCDPDFLNRAEPAECFSVQSVTHVTLQGNDPNDFHTLSYINFNTQTALLWDRQSNVPMSHCRT